MNVLFVSLTRFGDLLQTQASIHDVAQAGHTVGVVCLQNFLPTVHLMKHVEHVFPFVGNSLLSRMVSVMEVDGGLDVAPNSDGWLMAAKELKAWRDMIWREFAPAVVINLSPAKSSRLLAAYIGFGAFVGGFSLGTQGSFHNRSLWASVMQGAIGQRGIIPYNLVDIFRGITADSLCNYAAYKAAETVAFNGYDSAEPLTEGHGKPDCGGIDTAVTGRNREGHENFSHTSCGSFNPSMSPVRLLPPSATVCKNARNDLEKSVLALGFSGCVEADRSPKKDLREGESPVDELNRLAAEAIGSKRILGFVGIQLGASATERQWPLASFAQVANFLWERYRLVAVLLGTKDEVPLVKEYERLAKAPHVSMVGKTGLADLSALLLNCQFLLTNDTGTMHLAAGLGVPSFAIFLATAQPFDTGPYLPGCYCFEPDLPCHPCNFTILCPHNHICRTSIKPALVIACMEKFLLSRGIVRRESIGTASYDEAYTESARSNVVNPSHSYGAALNLPDSHTIADNVDKNESSRELLAELASLVSSGTEDLTGARVWRSSLNEEGALTLQPLLKGSVDSSHAYASSRGNLVDLQRRIIWAFVECHRTLLGEPAKKVRKADLLRINPALFMEEARQHIGRDAKNVYNQLEVLEKQGEVLLLRPVQLMQQRFLESWERVFLGLNESQWFCFLTSLWSDQTQRPDGDFQEVMAVVRALRMVFESVVSIFPYGE